MQRIPEGGSIGAGRVGIGANFAKARLMLAKRAGYLPNNTVIDRQRAPEQWKLASSNLARDSRAAGFDNPMQYLRQGATAPRGGPRPTATRPGAGANPAGALAYANSRMAAMQGVRPQRIGPGLPGQLPGAPAAGGLGANPHLAALLQALLGGATGANRRLAPPRGAGQRGRPGPVAPQNLLARLRPALPAEPGVF